MSIKGFVVGVFRDINTGEITKTFEEENHVSRWMIEQHCQPVGNIPVFGRTIYVTNLAYETTNLGSVRRGTNNHAALGFTESGVTNPVGGGGSGYDPYYITFQQRFNPPAVDRPINYVGMTSDTSIAGYQIFPSHCGVQLTTTCTQTTTETLDVFYRVQFSYDYDVTQGDVPAPDNIGIDKGQAYLLYIKHLSNTGTQWPTDDSETRWNGNIDPRLLQSSNSPDFCGDNDMTYISVALAAVGRMRLENSATISTHIGSLMGFFGYGDSGSTQRYNSLAVESSADPIQNLFPHGPSATKPFFDSSNLPAGDASVAFGGDTWTNPSFPKMYRVNMTATGAVGVSTYQLWERNVFGFFNNTYVNWARGMHSMLIQNDHMYGDFRFRNDTDTFASYGPRCVRYGNDEKLFIAIRKTSVCLADSQSETGTHFIAADYPAFTTTDITDYAVDSSGDIYIADRASADGTTGALYKITDPTGSPVITKIDDTTTGLTGAAGPNVFGVAVGRNDRLWIVMDGGLFYSDNGGTSWTQATYSFVGISDGNWARVKQIIADPEHVNDHLGIVYHTGGNSTIFACWYEFSTTTASQGPNVIGSYSTPDQDSSYYWSVNEEYTYIDSLAASPSQSKWGCASRSSNSTGGYPAYFVFGTTTINQYASRAHTTRSVNIFETDDDGNQSLFNIPPWDGNVYFGFCKDSTTIVRSVVSATTYFCNTYMAGCPMVLLPNGVLLSKISYWEVAVGCMSGNNESGGVLVNLNWRKYGWNGAAWEIGNAGSKTTHGTEDAAVDGLTIQFDDDSGAESFSIDDYYTVGCLKGIWLDGSTEFTHNSYVYYNPSFRESELEVSVIPAVQRIARYRTSDGNTMTWQDLTSQMAGTTNALYQNGHDAGPAYDRGGRSVNTTGGAVPTVPYASTTPVIVARYMFQVMEYTAYDNANAAQMVTGLSDTSVIGTAVSYSSPQFAIHFDGKAYPGSYNAAVSIVESGITVYTLPDPLYMAYVTDQGSYDATFRVAIYSDGSVVYNFEDYVMHTSPPGTANPLLTYVVDQASTGDATNGVTDVVFEKLATNAADYVFEIGTNGSPTTGLYRDGFQNIDYTNATTQFYLDGVLATLVTNDYSTVLPAGTVALQYYYGEVRVSASDVGKALTATYLTHTNY